MLKDFIDIKGIKSRFSKFERKGFFYFALVLLASHFLWKFAVDGNVDGQEVSVFGKDMTSQFYRISLITADWVYGFMKLLPGSDNLMREGAQIFYKDENYRINIIWACNSIKQFYIFIIIIASYMGPFKHKLWFIPMGLLILEIYNILRIAFLCWFTQDNLSMFYPLHELSGHIFYIIIFILWFIWDKKFSIKDLPVPEIK